MVAVPILITLDSPGIGINQPNEDPQLRALSATARSDQHGGLSCLEVDGRWHEHLMRTK